MNLSNLHTRERATALVLGFAAFLLFALTMSRGITWLNHGMDGGDFISAARLWGVPHPTGYPTYTIALRIFGDVVAIGDHAFRTNLFSAVAGALTVPFVFLSARRVLQLLPDSEVGSLQLRYWAAVLAALAFATSRLFWSQSTITEVYTLNALFASVLLLLGLKIVEQVRNGEPATRLKVVAALVFGIGLGNHTTLGLMAAPFGIWILWLIWKNERWRGVLEWRPLVALLAGLSVYAYVPIAAAVDPQVNWGVADSIEGLRWMVLGSIYQPYAFGLSNEYISGRIATIAELLFTQYTVIGMLLGIAGLTTIWNYSRPFVIASLSAVIVIAVYAVSYDTVDSFIYLILGFMLFSTWIAVGAANLATSITKWLQKRGGFEPWVPRVPGLVVGLVALLIPVWSLGFGWSETNLADDPEPREFVELTVERASGGIVLAEEPQLFPLVYESIVGSPDSDVMVVGPVMLQFDWYWDQLATAYPDRMPGERPDGYSTRLQAIVGHNFGHVPIYATHDDRDHYDQFVLIEDGELFRVE